MVIEASRAGAQAAAVLPDPAVRSREPKTARLSVYSTRHTYVRSPQVSTDVSHFYPGGLCHRIGGLPGTLSDLSVPGIPGSTTITASTTAPIDPYRSVS